MLKIRVSLFLLCIYFYQSLSIDIYDDQIYFWKSPNPYETSDELQINVEEGYYLSINVTDIDIDGDKGDHLLIKPGANGEGDGRVFTYNIKTPRYYIIYSNQVTMKFVVKGTNELKKKGFIVSYQRYGTLTTTTTESTMTTVDWPTASPEDSEVREYVGRLPFADYSLPEVQTNFTKAVAEMARSYCETQNIDVVEITEANVHIKEIKACPLNWPDSDLCAEIRFAVPVFLVSSNEYQLTAKHLHQMWLKMASDYLVKYEMDVFFAPDDNSTVIWLAISGSALILFAILLCLLKELANRLQKRPRKNSDTKGVMQDSSSRNSYCLEPDNLQSVPSIFDQYDPHSFTYENKGMSENEDEYEKKHELSDQEDDFDVDIKSLEKTSKLKFVAETFETYT